MAKTNEIYKDFRERVLGYQVGKYYKANSRGFGVDQSTVRQMREI